MPTKEDERFAEWSNEAKSLGEFRVRMLLTDPMKDDRLRFFEAWLSDRDADKRDAREERTLWIAIVANILAAVAAIAAIAAAYIAYLAYSAELIK